MFVFRVLHFNFHASEYFSDTFILSPCLSHYEQTLEVLFTGVLWLPSVLFLFMALLRLWSNFCATGWYWPSYWALIFAVISVDGGSTLTEVCCGSSSRLDLKRSFCPKRYVPKRVFGHVSSGGSVLPDPSFAELPGCTPVDTMITALYQLVSDVGSDMHYDRFRLLTHLLYWILGYWMV